MGENYMEIRKDVCWYAKKMERSGFVTGSSGNISVRVPGGDDKEDVYVITPTHVAYDELAPENVVPCDEEGDEVVEIENAPSFELPLHVAIYKARPDVKAIIHTHSLYSTILSVLRIPLPPIVEELVPYLGGSIEVSEYGQSGTDELAEATVKALGEKAAAFIANHGNVCVGKNLEKAWDACMLVEHVARIYIEALKLEAGGFGKVTTLPDDVIESEMGMYEVVKDF